MTDALNNSAERDLRAHFNIKSLSLPRLLLGMHINIEPNMISLSQSHYVEFLLEKYGLTEANPVSTPIDPNVKLNAHKMDSYELEREIDSTVTYRYAQLISSLMYLALG